MRKDDYFTTQDMTFYGPEVWERVRAKLRAEGNDVIKGYGEYSHTVDGRHFIYLNGNGNLIHTAGKPKGLQIDIQKFLKLGSVTPLKIKTGSDLAVVAEAFEYLVGLGFSDKNRSAIMRKGDMVGLLADSDGVIYSILTLDGFINKYSAAEELEFDKEVKVSLSNFRPVRRIVELKGVSVYEDVFEQFLKVNAIKSAT